MDGWIYGQTYGCLTTGSISTVRGMDGWMKERDGWLEDGWTCRSVDGWMDEQIKTKLCTGFLSD